MYNFDKKKNLIEHNFSSVSELLSYIETVDFSPNFYERASDNAGYEFTHTESYSEAVEICRMGGTKEEIRKANEIVNDLEKQTKIIYTRPKRYAHFVGFAPIVPAYLQGNPLNMYNTRKEKRKKIDVYFGAEVTGETQTDDIYEKGITTMAIIKLLEKHGYNVNLNFFTALETDTQTILAKILLKGETQRLDIASNYFPMCHPAFSRRLIYRLIEKSPDADKMWQDKYGRVCTENTARYLLGASQDDIMIKTLVDARKTWDKAIAEKGEITNV